MVECCSPFLRDRIFPFIGEFATLVICGLGALFCLGMDTITEGWNKLSLPVKEERYFDMGKKVIPKEFSQVFY